MGNTTRPTWRDEAEAQGITLTELARRTGITKRAIYAYSRGDRQPKPEWIEKVTTVLDVLSGARVA